MAPPFTRIYTDAQREAIAHAVIDLKIHPTRAALELAERGELPGTDGRALAAFHMPLATARDIVATSRRRRSGRLASELASAPATSQADIVRTRLMSIADHELRAVEREIARGKEPDMKRASLAARVVREALALRAGSVLERDKRALNAHTNQPPSAATPALRRLAGERVQGPRPLTLDDTNTNERQNTSDDVAAELEQALADANERINADAPANTAPASSSAESAPAAPSTSPRSAPRSAPQSAPSGEPRSAPGSHAASAADAPLPLAGEAAVPVVAAA